MKKRVAVIGAGASGMVCALECARAGLDVVVFEKSAKVGRKILATGNGRCNITNKNITVQNYHGKDPSFVKHVLKRFDVREFFNKLGLELVEGANGRMYPMSLQALSVVSLLEYALEKEGVKVSLLSEVKNIEKINGIFKVDDKEFDVVVIASGTGAMPTLGSSDSGYRFARVFGHQIVKPFASLVQLVSKDEMVTSASGVKIDADLDIFVDGNSTMQVRGDLLFTNYGLSGSAILDISRVASEALSKKEDVKIVIDLLPDLSIDALKSLLQKRSKLNMPLSLWLNGIVHKKVIRLIFFQAKLDEKSTINTKTINKLTYTLKNLSVNIDSTKGVKSCEVMAGGVNTQEIDAKTMHSKLVDGLYFCGEVLDIDGDCGGYNLHFAWASGYVAAKEILKN